MITACGLLCLSAFTGLVLKVHPCCGLCQDFSPFHGWLVLHRVDVLCLFIQEMFLCFGYHTKWWHSRTSLHGPKLQFLLGVYRGVGLLAHLLTLHLTFWGTAKPFCRAAVQIFIPISNIWGFQYLPIFLTLVTVNFFPYSGGSFETEGEHLFITSGMN